VWCLDQITAQFPPGKFIMRAITAMLIIEDNPGDVRLLCAMLRENASYCPELIHVATMREAEQYLSANRSIDLILLDMGLPDAHGLAAVQRVRAIAPQAPLVLLTAMDDAELAALALRAGAQDYLIKGQIEARGLVRALRYAAERKRLEQLKDEFVATVSHELRTPLTSIAGSLGLLMAGEGRNLPGPAARLLKIAHSNSERLVKLVNDILDVEKLESGSLVFDRKRIDVCSLVETAIAETRSSAESCGVRLRLLGDSEAKADVRADASRLSQVVANLLSNAIKFSERGDEVEVKVEKEADLVRISVRNHGGGISNDFKSRIFGRFAQADATNTRKKGGAGLGLNIVKQIVDRLGGKVGFVDAVGGGTIFNVELPSWEGKADLIEERRLKDISAVDAGDPLAVLATAARDRLLAS
jgi:signal transduction histidine kinase